MQVKINRKSISKGRHKVARTNAFTVHHLPNEIDRWPFEFPKPTISYIIQYPTKVIPYWNTRAWRKNSCLKSSAYGQKIVKFTSENKRMTTDLVTWLGLGSDSDSELTRSIGELNHNVQKPTHYAVYCFLNSIKVSLRPQLFQFIVEILLLEGLQTV